MITRARPLLGTYVEIRCKTSDVSVVQEAFSAIERVHRLMSFHEQESELSLLNREAQFHPVAVHPWTWRVLRACRRLYIGTQGLFDPSIASRLVAAGLLPPPSTTMPDLTASFSNVLFFDDRRISFSKPLWLDLGGIAKGFAVDVAIATLRARGVRHATVNAGGDLRTLGEPQEILIRDPLVPTRLLSAGHLRNGAIATSGDYFNEASVSAITAPGSKPRAPCEQSVSIVARTCMMADALTKVAMLAPSATRKRLLSRFGARMISIPEKACA